MKKNKICGILTAILSLLLCLLPIQKPSAVARYVSTIQSFFNGIFFVQMSSLYLREYLLFLLCLVCIVFASLNAFKRNRHIDYLNTISIAIYVILWLIVICAPVFPNRLSIIQSVSTGLNILWLLLYFFIIIAIIVLQVIQHISLIRRPPKTERLQAQIDELQKQVDELKNDK